MTDKFYWLERAAQIIMVAFPIAGFLFAFWLFLGPQWKAQHPDTKRLPISVHIWLVGIALWIVAVLSPFKEYIDDKVFLNETRGYISDQLAPLGGWDALHKECDRLVAGANTDIESQYPWPHHPAQWPVLAALHPRPPVFFPGKFKDDGTLDASEVRLKLRGFHSTGRSPTPYYGLVVLIGTNSYVPNPQKELYNHKQLRLNKITETIYEVY